MFLLCLVAAAIGWLWDCPYARCSWSFFLPLLFRTGFPMYFHGIRMVFLVLVGDGVILQRSLLDEVIFDCDVSGFLVA